MGRCALDVCHPKFKKIVDRYKGHPDFQKSLDAFAALVMKDHRLSGWVNHPMPGLPEYQNRIWKWDFKPAALDQSGTRKGWRIFALADSAIFSSTPTPATAFFVYDKADEPKGQPSAWIAKALKEFLRNTSVNEATAEEPFRHFIHGDGKTVSLCQRCFDTVFISDVMAEIEMAEASHACANGS